MKTLGPENYGESSKKDTEARIVMPEGEQESRVL